MGLNTAIGTCNDSLFIILVGFTQNSAINTSSWVAIIELTHPSMGLIDFIFGK